MTTNNFYKYGNSLNIMKRFLIVAAIFLLFLGGAWGQNTESVTIPHMCSDSSQIILKLDKANNAHAATWDSGSEFGLEVCFYDFFNETYNGTNPHSCATDGSNLLLKLSEEDNAHAENAAGTNFGVDVCYGDLVCELKPNITDCGNIGSRKGSVIVSFMGETENAHLTYGDRIVDESQNLVLCCYSEIPPICNFDTYCDVDSGETVDNCGDCGNPVCDINGEVGGFEECDCGEDGICEAGDFGGESCSSLRGAEYGGNLSCDPDTCQIITNYCYDTTSANPNNFCSDYSAGGANFLVDYGCEGSGPCPINSCEGVNHINIDPSDFPSDHDTLNEFKEAACNQCWLTSWTSYVQGAISTCEWDSINNKCSQEDSFSGGLQCKQIIVDAGTCDSGGATKTIQVKYEKVGGPDEENCAAGIVELQVPCAKSVKLPFFSKINFLASFMIIGLIYFIYVRKRK